MHSGDCDIVVHSGTLSEHTHNDIANTPPTTSKQLNCVNLINFCEGMGIIPILYVLVKCDNMLIFTY